MIDLILFMVAGIGTGILVGLLPALPVYMGPFLLYQFQYGMSLEEILIYWLATYVGSQFFGSIATITTNIPGEESALIYIEDLKNYTLEQKNNLLYDTAFGSFIGGFVASLLMWGIVTYFNNADFGFFYSVKTQMAIYGTLILALIYANRHSWFLTTLTVIFGLAIAPNSNYALPELWYDFQWLFQGYTFYLVLLGTMIIPLLFHHEMSVTADHPEHFEAKRSRNFQWFNMIKSSILGFFAGLIPGPSASIGSTAAYKLIGKNNNDKIVAAETANNSAVLASVIPFMILALPINQNTAIMAGIMDLRIVDVQEAIMENSEVFESIAVIDTVTILLLFSLGIFYLLSTTLIDYYVKLLILLHDKIKAILILLVGFLIYLDLSTAEITTIHYFILLAFFTCIGFLLRAKRISAVPMIFAILFGDKIVWSTIQISKLYF